ncbi:unnamed protein product [Paramecium pentaurelia]|uniref:Uncharacterized protein n=1 Tax=Paramecium pentaurelia TaxID=43138 RepID=A0A8S1XL47_9CILI|nr:unnamed protein product [Paramecium pentaurelia]
MHTKILQDLEAQQQEFKNNSIQKKLLIIIILRIINHMTIQQLIQQIKLQSWLPLKDTSTVDRNIKIICKSLKKQQFKSWNKQDTKQLYQYVEISIMIQSLFHSSKIQYQTKQHSKEKIQTTLFAHKLITLQLINNQKQKFSLIGMNNQIIVQLRQKANEN